MQVDHAKEMILLREQLGSKPFQVSSEVQILKEKIADLEKQLKEPRAMPVQNNNTKHLEMEINDLKLQMQILATEKDQAEERVRRLQDIIEQNYGTAELHTQMREELALCKSQVEAKLRDVQKARQRDNHKALQEQQSLQLEVTRL